MTRPVRVCREIMNCQQPAYFLPNFDYILLPYILLMFVLSVKSHLIKGFEQ